MEITKVRNALISYEFSYIRVTQLLTRANGLCKILVQEMSMQQTTLVISVDF